MTNEDKEAPKESTPRKLNKLAKSMRGFYIDTALKVGKKLREEIKESEERHRKSDEEK